MNPEERGRRAAWILFGCAASIHVLLGAGGRLTGAGDALAPGILVGSVGLLVAYIIGFTLPLRSAKRTVTCLRSPSSALLEVRIFSARCVGV